MKIIVLALLFSFTSLFIFADDPPSVVIQYTGNFGPFFREYSVPSETLFSVVRSEPSQMKELLEKGMLRMAITTEPPKNNPKWKVTRLALSATILAVHPDNPIRDIASIDAVALLQQKFGCWRTLGGSLTRIHLYKKADSSLPRPVIHTCPDHSHGHAHEKEKEPKKKQNFFTTFSKPLLLQTANDNKSFSLLFTDPTGLACFDITRYDETRVPLLSVDGIPPTLKEFESGRYPLLTTYYLVEPADPTPQERHLSKYILGWKFARQLYEAGYLPFLRKTAKKDVPPASKTQSSSKNR